MTTKSTDPVDDLLVMQAQDGDRRSMEELVRRWQRRLWTHAYRLTGRTDAAWDITQQAWVAIVKGLRKLHDPARFRAWAYRIVANKAADHLKSGPVVGADTEGAAAPARQDERLALRELLGRLEGGKRQVLVLYYLEGLRSPSSPWCSAYPKAPSSHACTPHARSLSVCGRRRTGRRDMSDEELRRIIDDASGYDEAKEDTLLQMAGEFYGRQMRLIAVVVWINALVAIALGVFSAVEFFRTEQVKQEIMYAALFVVAWVWLVIAKAMAWLWMVRNRITREIKRLEIRLADVSAHHKQRGSQ